MKENMIDDQKNMRTAAIPETQKTPFEPVRGFISAPTAADLKPTELEVFLLRCLWKWQITSTQSPIVLD